MASISPAIGAKLVLPAAKTYYDGFSGVQFRPFFPNWRRYNLNRISKTICANAETKNTVAIDYNDPDWISKFQTDFENRFRIPHVTDVFDDAVSYPSTFCLKMRYLTENFFLVQLLFYLHFVF